MVVGKVVRPHGVKGCVKVECYMDSPGVLASIAEVAILNKKYKIERVVSLSPTVIKLGGIDSVDAAEALRGAEIIVDRSLAPPPPKGRHYIGDLVGSGIVIDGAPAGVLKEILQHGSADVYSVEGDRNFMFPYVGGVISDIDTENRIIELNSSELEKVAVYED